MFLDRPILPLKRSCMAYFILVVLLASLSNSIAIQHTNASDVWTLAQPAGSTDLSEFKWTNRPVIVFADSPADPRFSEQITLLESQIEELQKRDVVILTDTDPEALSPLRKKLRPRGFMLVLVGKDGTVYLRKPFPWSVRELSRSIDKMPLRQQEIRDRREQR